jgi:hypothetical protein
MHKAKRRSHPYRFAAVSLIKTGRATKKDIHLVLNVSPQLVHYWCIEAGINGKIEAAHLDYVARELFKSTPQTENPELEHEAIRRLRARLQRPKPSKEQLDRAHIQKIKDMGNGDLSAMPSPSSDWDIS